MADHLQCPKCSNKKLAIVEHIVCPELLYQNVNGQVTYISGIEGGPCYAIKWIAKCLDCKHEWRLRKRIPDATVAIPSYADAKEIEKWLRGEKVVWAENSS